MSTRNNIDPLDTIFARARGTEPYVVAGEFSASVMKALPKGRRLMDWQDAAITLAFTVAGCILAYGFFPVERLSYLVPNQFVITPVMLLGVTGCVGAVCGGAYWAAETSKL